MKKIAFLFLAALAVISCGALTTTPQEEAENAAEVAACLDDEAFVIDIDTIYPQIGIPIHDTGYSITVKDGKVNSYLPFFGTSDTAIFSTDKSGIEFEECPVKLKKKKSKDGTDINFKALSGNTEWQVGIHVWSNGNCNITCVTSSKSIMRYDGKLKAVKP